MIFVEESPLLLLCGSVFTESQRLEGRSDDTYFKRRWQQPDNLIRILFDGAFLFVENIQDYQVTQLADGSITIALSHRQSLWSKRFCSI